MYIYNDDLYKILESSKEDPIHIINKNFKRLAMRYHPDKNNVQSDDIFKKLVYARNILTDEIKKDLYDKKIKYKAILYVDISINDILNSIVQQITINRKIIICDIESIEIIKLNLKISDNVPVNKSIILNNLGTKYNNIIGDLYININIINTYLYRINITNYNIVLQHKISLIQSLCGFELVIPYKINNPIIIHIDKIIKNNISYFINNKGITYIDEDNNINKSNIQIYFEINYDNISNDFINQLKKLANYNNCYKFINNATLS